ncbi:hypothetical protein TI06_23330, partial [Vibrio vulnificus]
MHQGEQDAAWHRHAVGIFEVVAAVAAQVAGLGAQRLQQPQQRVVAGLARLGAGAGADQAGGMLGGATPGVVLHPGGG